MLSIGVQEWGLEGISQLDSIKRTGKGRIRVGERVNTDIEEVSIML